MSHRLKVCLLVVALIVAGGALVPPASAHPMPKKTRDAELHFAKRCGEHSVRAIKACIHRAALHWKTSYHDGLYVASRETGANDSNSFDPNICNSQGSGACGLFQFMPGTWGSTPYGSRDVFSAKWNALGWAWLYRQPGAPCTHWSICK